MFDVCLTYDVCLTHCAHLQEVRRLNDPLLNLHWTHTYAQIQQKRCLVADLALEDKINALAGVLTNLGTVHTVVRCLCALNR